LPGIIYRLVERAMKYAIFDLDGTLLDSMWVWENIDLAFYKKYGLSPAPGFRDRVRSLSVRKAAELLNATFCLGKSSGDIIIEISELGKDDYQNKVEAKPLVRETLERLRGEGVRMCVATASVRANAEAALSRLSLLHYFEFLITGDEVGSGKDNPEIYLKCAERLGARPGEVTVFEDALHAAATAKRAGFRVVGVYDRSADADAPEMRKICDRYIMDFGEL